jgi:DNA-binding LytR/AlgR family response regulator
MAKSDLKVLVVDDEALARADIHYMLKALPEISAVTECANATEALSLLQDEAFDVIFLDIQMPGMNGLKAVRIINQLDNPPKIVFVTAYDEHATKAFELDVVDYLVKPFNSKRLSQAVTKVLRALNTGDPRSQSEFNKAKSSGGHEVGASGGDSQFKKIPVEKGEGVLLISFAEVRYISAHDDKVTVHTFDEQYPCRFSLAELDSRLSTQGFNRVHRGYIVNLQHILELQPFLNGTYNLIIDDKKQNVIPVSRSRMKSLRSLIGV